MSVSKFMGNIEKQQYLDDIRSSMETYIFGVELLHRNKEVIRSTW